MLKKWISDITRLARCVYYALPPRRLPDAALELEAHQLVDLSGKLHWQFVENLVAEARDDDAHRRLRVDAALLEVEQLVLANL